MGDATSIEWTDASLTPVRARNIETGQVGWHCEHESLGCKRCYAEGINLRLGTQLPFRPALRPNIETFLDLNMLAQPSRWRRPRKIFLCSMTDLFGSFVSDEIIDQVIAMVAACPWHTFQVLTKRAGRMREYFTAPDLRARLSAALLSLLEGPGAAQWARQADHIRAMAAALLTAAGTSSDPLPMQNLWLGVSVENQAAANLRIHHLQQTPAAIRFLSCEPLLSDLNLLQVDYPGLAYEKVDVLNRGAWDEQGEFIPLDTLIPGIDWIIVGGESGPLATLMHPSWVRSIRNQAEQAGVPFHFKQWGTWGLAPDDMTFDEASALAGSRKVVHLSTGQTMIKMGKKAAGRLLDGKEHNGMPAPRLAQAA
jgi:protein gp37